jgi:tRNA A-37 threonylcarbamoyl transferase component Bud32
MATVLDTDALTECLRIRLPGLDFHAVRQCYVHYKPATSCLVAYSLVADGTEYLFYAKAYGPDAQVKFKKTRRLSGIATQLGPGTVIFDHIATAVYLFPVDHRLKALKRFADRDTQCNLVKQFYPDRPELHAGRLTTLTYKPERRYVARLDLAEKPQAVLKFYNPAGYDAARMAARNFESRGELQLPRLAACSDRYQALAFDWLEGCMLNELLRQPDVAQQQKISALQHTGAALADLQRQQPEGLAHRSPDSERSRLAAQAETIGHLSPHLSQRARQLAQQLADALGDRPPGVCALHGDFYHRQVLVRDDRAVILDLDNAVLGDPAADPGLFIAHLERDVLRNELDADDRECFAEAFLQGYRQAGQQPDGERTRPYTAIGLFYLAAEPFRYREPDWPARIEALLGRIEALITVDSGTGAVPASGIHTAGRRSCLSH